jgi:hypothetical protein
MLWPDLPALVKKLLDTSLRALEHRGFDNCHRTLRQLAEHPQPTRTPPSSGSASSAGYT